MSEGIGDPVNILLVDDRPSNLTSLAAVLDRTDYRLVLANSGEEALSKVLREDFAVILLDVAMPRMDGLETAQFIKQRDRSKHIPILFVTASVYDINSIERAYESGAVDYLQKPLEPLLVRAKVSVFVELFRQRKQIEEQARLLRDSERREQQHEQRRREAERRRFLDEASEMLFGSLDQQETLKALSAIIPRRIPDLCVVYTLHDERLELVESSVADLSQWALYERLGFEDRVPIVADARVAESMETGRALVIPPGEPDVLSAFCRDSTDEEGGSRVQGILFVPLKGKERNFGGVLIVRQQAPHEEELISLSEELSRRATIALDNARLFEEATSAVHLRDEFLSIASHELRTPLTALQLFLQRMEQLLVAPSPGPKAGLLVKLRGAIRQMDRLSRLVENLLDVSRIRTGTLQLHLEEVDAASVVGELVERFRDQAARAQSELRLTIEARPRARWDRLRIEQVLDNLLSNALKYAPGSPVEVGVAEDGEGGARIWVRDRGMGIRPEDLSRVFGRFERAVPVRHYGGLGLGLYIAEQIVRAHGGRIRVTSDQGEGACFILELPLEATPPASMEEARV